MNGDDKIAGQAYKVNIKQGKAILLLLAEVERLIALDDPERTSKTILDLSRAMSNIGGKPA